jgi:hypothetical protein
MNRFPVEDLRLYRMASLWPTDLRLEIDPVEIGTVDIQRWIHKNKAPVVRIKCASRTERRAFDDLIESLRNCGGVSLRNAPASPPSHALDSTQLQGGRSETVTGRDFSSRRLALAYCVRHFPPLASQTHQRLDHMGQTT